MRACGFTWIGAASELMFVYCKQKRETGSSRQAGKHGLMLVYCMQKQIQAGRQYTQRAGSTADRQAVHLAINASQW